MNINVQYTMEAEPLANASLIFTEKKPLFLYSIGFVNIIALIFLTIMILKGVLFLSLTLEEGLIVLVFSAWVFLRRTISRWVLLRKMQKSAAVGKKISIDFSRNGISWSGEGLKTNHLAWQHISYIIEIGNGLIIPFSITRFLWVPFAGFKSKLQIDKIKNLIIEKRVPLRIYSKLNC